MKPVLKALFGEGVTPALGDFRIPPLFRADFTDAAKLRTDFRAFDTAWTGNHPAIGSPIALALDELHRPASADPDNQLLVPDFYLDPSIEGELNEIVTFTRSGGGATRFNPYGVMEVVPENTPRIDHDPGTYCTSDTEVTLSADLDFLTLDVTVQYTVGASVRVTYDDTHWFAGIVLSASSSAVTLLVQKVVGTGTYSSWHVIECLGLLIEEPRTNDATQSNGNLSLPTTLGTGSVTDNYGVAPDGTTTSMLISGTSGYGRQRGEIAAHSTTYNNSIFVARGTETISLLIGITSGGSNTISGTFDTATGVFSGTGELLIEKCPGGWWRMGSVHTSPSSGTPVRFLRVSVQDGHSVEVWGLDLQTGAFLTSHIPTAGSVVTRAGDAPLISGANFTDWFNNSEGTFLANFMGGLESNQVGYGRVIGSGSSQAFLARQHAGAGGVNTWNGILGQSLIRPGADPVLAFSTAVMAYSEAGRAVARLGAIATDDKTIGELPTGIALGRNFNQGTACLNGHIRRIAYYRNRLPNHILQAMTL